MEPGTSVAKPRKPIAVQEVQHTGGPEASGSERNGTD